MPPNAKFISVHITSSISDDCSQEVVGVVKNKVNNSGMKTTALCSLVFG